MLTREKLQQAMLAGDHDAVVDLYAPDVRLNSPLIKTPFEGRGAVATVYVRPLAAQARVAQALGVPLARHRGRWQARLMAILGRPLPLLFGGLDVLAPRLTQLRRR